MRGGLAFPTPAGIGGDVNRGEWIFPLIQYTGDRQFNIAAVAFENCRINFRPSTVLHIYLAFAPSDKVVELLQKSIFEFSRNRPNFSIIFLYAAIEAASAILTGDETGRVSARLHKLASRIDSISECHGKILRRLKKKIENRIVKKRGEFAHKGIDLVQGDLLPSYKTALEFFWYYAEFKQIVNRMRNGGAVETDDNRK